MNSCIFDTKKIKKIKPMKLASLTKNKEYQEKRPAVKVLIDTGYGKEIRILFKKDQFMKEHTAPFPIVVEIFEGRIDFGVEGEIQHLKAGDLIFLEASVPHDLLALEDSIVRLSLQQGDSAKRVKEVAEK